MLQQYIGTDVVIHCSTPEESFAINKLITEIGGKDLHSSYNGYKDKTCYSLKRMPGNTYGDTEWFRKHEYTIIPAAEILSSITYQIY